MNAFCDAALLVGADAQVLFATPSAARLLGKPVEDLIGRNVLPLFDPETAARLAATLAGAEPLDGASLEGGLADRGAVRAVGLTLRDLSGAAGASRLLALTLTGGGSAAEQASALQDDLERAHREIARLSAQVGQLDTGKEDLLDALSHDLATPIAVIQGSIENLLDGLHGELSPAQQRALEIVRRNSRRLTHAISERMDRSAAEAPRGRG